MTKSTTAEETPDQTVVYLGNRNAIQIIENPDDPSDFTREAIKGAPKKNMTAVTLAPGLSLLQAAVQITDPARGVWQAHSDDEAPAWVASTDAGLARVLSDHWGGIEIREPDHELARVAFGAVPADAPAVDEEA
jgi:hypothetical protein